MEVLDLKSQKGRKPKIFPLFLENDRFTYSTSLFTYCSQFALYDDMGKHITENRKVSWCCNSCKPSPYKIRNANFIGHIIQDDMFYIMKSKNIIVFGNPDDNNLYSIPQNKFFKHVDTIKKFYREGNFSTFNILAFSIL